MKPRWRWWLFCIGLDLWFRFGWEWSRRLFGWATLIDWLAVADDDPILSSTGEAPF